MATQKIEVRFPSEDSECVGDLYLPVADGRQSVVVMAHGFGAERTWSLPEFAKKFAENGLGVLIFDYRNFGDSPGEPRQWVSPSRHRADYRAALKFLRAHPRVDANRLGLWGASLSGGNALMVAAEDQSIRALSCLVPLFDAWPVMAQLPPLGLIPVTAVAIADTIASLFGQSVKMPITGSPGEFAFLSFPGWKESILGSVPTGSRWTNAMPARIALEMAMHRPVLSADRVKCPTLIMYGRRDEGIPVASVLETAKKIPQAEVEAHAFGHTQPFREPWLSKVATRQIEFFRRHLLTAG